MEKEIGYNELPFELSLKDDKGVNPPTTLTKGGEGDICEIASSQAPRNDDGMTKDKIIKKLEDGSLSLDGAIFYTLMLILERLETLNINNNK